ncbi:unnamed protein product (macronuclear) [Paramecium tetraurelia]|uniref:Uncharacterized protein n=1 Tax=Paramecium tetraurelia TaxID=5888 RepID=A0CKP3_PARTE|nr:uncharacterized protein GSPATT00001074001 [Paramecium tetraurelia]CAK71360.1 unnamed protein product [Paramecium tetraurelia]|eukprot:XP_001438757.1 hypothetical protein (macronuclear) [Paramecium tetraurelia strain d4-2]
MIKLEAHTFNHKNGLTPAQLSNKSPIDIVRSKKIIFKRELLNTEQNFLVQTDEHQEIIYIKPDVPDLIMTDLTNMAIQEDISEYQALEYHNRAAKLLEFYTQNQIQVQYTSVLFSKINYAIILKKYAAQNEALEMLLDCVQILKIKGQTLKKNPPESLSLAKTIQNKLLRLRLIFQITLLFSETKKNKQALEMAKSALRILKSIIQNTIKLCQLTTGSSSVNKKQRANSEISSPLQKNQAQNPPQQQSQILSYPQIVEAVFKEILISIKTMLPNDDKSHEVMSTQNLMIRNFQNRSQSLFASEYVFQPQNNQQNKLFTIIDDTHPMLQMQILGLMQLTYVDLEELFPINSFEMVMAEEVILELIMLTGLSFYSISTELRFINNQQNKLTVEIWLGKAVEIFYTYVPHSSAIFNQIYQVYQKLYGVDKQSIPEDEEVEYHTKLLKPHPYNNKSTLSNKVVIIIKVPNHNKQSKETETKQSQNTQTTFQKIQQTILAKKQAMLPQKHIFTQPDTDKKFDTWHDETEKSPQQQQKLFIQKHNKSLNSTDIRQRVEILMNQILNQQAKLTQEKLKQKHTPITILKQKYQAASKVQENQKTFNPFMTSQFKTTISASRSLSNSRKASQANLKSQSNGVKTAQMRYRTQISTITGDDSSKQLAQQISTQLASLNRQSNKGFLQKRSESVKKTKIPFQQR